jgi:hypothetical protein
MELSPREEIPHEGSVHVDTVGVRGSKPLPRTITVPGGVASETSHNSAEAALVFTE